MYIRKKIILLLILLSCFSYGQNLKEEENHEKAISFLNQNNKDSLFYYTQKLQESKNHCRRFLAMYFEANYYYYNSEYTKCKEKLDEILTALEDHKTSDTYTYSERLVGKTYTECINIVKLNIYRRFFHIHRNQGNYIKAYDYLTLRKEIVDSLPERNTYYLRQKISVEKERSFLKKSVSDYKSSLKILTDVSDQIKNVIIDSSDLWYKQFLLEKSDIYVGIGIAYNYLSSEDTALLDSADFYYDKAFALTQKHDDTSKRHKRTHYLRKASINYRRREYNATLKYLDTVEKFNNKSSFSSNKLKARVYNKTSQIDSAIFYAAKTLKLIEKKDGLELDRTYMIEILAKNYYKKNEYDSAFVYSQRLIETIENESKTKLETERFLKEDEIAEIQELNASIHQKMKKSKGILNIIIVSSFISIIGMVFFYRKKRTEQSKLIEDWRSKYDKLLNINTKNRSYTIDTSLEEKILIGLNKIEETDIFLDKNLNLQVLSKLLNTNTSYLSKIINKHKEKTFRQYVTQIRIERLIKNLDDDPIQRKYSIQTLGESIGYPNAPSFTRAFKNYMGLSPSEYLKKKYYGY